MQKKIKLAVTEMVCEINRIKCSAILKRHYIVIATDETLYPLRLFDTLKVRLDAVINRANFVSSNVI